MESIFTMHALLIAIGIFFLRVCDMSMDTIRVLFVVRGKRLLAWILGVMEFLIFVVAISSVLTGPLQPLSVVGYATGFATGNVVGMWIEELLAIGFIQITVVSSNRGALIGEQLRKNGFGVTEILARGKDGTVAMMQLNVRRREVATVDTIALEADPNAFITAEDVRPLRRGFWRS
jgi:uncharacterized protein YebE (UPF0316 family)